MWNWTKPPRTGWSEHDVKKIKDHWSSLTHDNGEEDEETDRATGLESANVQARTFFEFWIKHRFERDPLTKEKNPRVKKWLVQFHYDSKTLLYVGPHPNNNGLWPYFDYAYWKRNGKWLARGICATLESDEKEINAIHKQRRDAATAANTVVLNAKKDSGITEENAAQWPMKVNFMDDPEKDLVPMSIGKGADIGALIAEEQQAETMVQRKVGLTDFNMGRDMGNLAKGRAGNRTVMAQIKENLRRMAMVLGNWRQTDAEIGMHIVELIQQYQPFGKVIETLGEDGNRLEKFLLLPQSPLRGRLKVRSRASDETLNEEVRRETLLLVHNILQGYYKQVLELTTLMSNPNASPDAKVMAMTTASRSSELMKEILDHFQIRSPERFLIETPRSFADLSDEGKLTFVTQMVNQLKGEGQPVALVDTRQAPQPTLPPVAPGQPPLPPQVGPNGPMPATS